MLMILLLLQSVTVSVPSKLHPCSGSHNHPLKLPWQSSQVHSCNNLYHFLVGLDFWGFFCLTAFNLNFMKLMTWPPPFSYFLRGVHLFRIAYENCPFEKRDQRSGTEENPKGKTPSKLIYTVFCLQRLNHLHHKADEKKTDPMKDHVKDNREASC